jgi:hypothetical protein
VTAVRDSRWVFLPHHPRRCWRRSQTLAHRLVPSSASLIHQKKMMSRIASVALAAVLVATCPACFRAGTGWWPEAGADVAPHQDAASLEMLRPPDQGSSPPGGTCVSRCCIGQECLEFGARLQAGLVLWVDRTSIVKAGLLLNRWRDRSPHGNDIVPVNPESPPRVQLDEVGPIVEVDEIGMVLATSANGMPFDRDDFTVLVLGRCDARTMEGPLFYKQSYPPRHGVRLYCQAMGPPPLPPARNRFLAELTDPERQADLPRIPSRDIYAPGIFHLAGVRRVDTTRVELRVDGAVQSEITIPEAVFLSSNPQIYIGASPRTISPQITEFDGAFAAVVVVRGPLTDAEVAELEAFLLRTSGKGAPPLVTSQ